jgi:cullin 3
MQPSSDPQLDKSFDLLAQAIHEIHRKNASILSFEELYRNAYSMVLQKRADTLYNGVKGVISEHLEHVAETEVVPAFVKTAGSDARASADAGTSFLMTLKRVWNDHTTSMLMIRDILMYMVTSRRYIYICLEAVQFPNTNLNRTRIMLSQQICLWFTIWALNYIATK